MILLNKEIKQLELEDDADGSHDEGWFSAPLLFLAIVVAIISIPLIMFKLLFKRKAKAKPTPDHPDDEPDDGLHRDDDLNQR